MNLNILFRKYKISVDPSFVLDRWSESHRSYHNIDHLSDLISKINEDFGNDKINENEREKLLLTALFHRIVHEPKRDDNQERSADIFYRFCNEQYNVDLVEVKQMILDTKTKNPCTPLSRKFLDYDLSVCESDFEQLLTWENNLREEYSFLSNEEYKKVRLSFVESVIDRYTENMDNLLDLMNWIKSTY